MVQRVSSPVKKNTLLGKSNYRCAHCGKSLRLGDRDLTIEHIIPRSRGGTNAPWNLCVLCKRCNEEKGSRLVDVRVFYKYLNKRAKQEVIGHIMDLRWEVRCRTEKG